MDTEPLYYEAQQLCLINALKAFETSIRSTASVVIECIAWTAALLPLLRPAHTCSDPLASRTSSRRTCQLSLPITSPTPIIIIFIFIYLNFLQYHTNINYIKNIVYIHCFTKINNCLHYLQCGTTKRHTSHYLQKNKNNKKKKQIDNYKRQKG